MDFFQSYLNIILTGVSLVFGNIDSSLGQAITKGNALNSSKNGPFDLLILLASNIVNDHTDLIKLHDGELSVDLPTRLVISEKISPDTELPAVMKSSLEETGTHTLCKNLTVYTETEGTNSLKNVDGLEMAWASDRNVDGTTGTFLPSTDILISNKWPLGILKNVNPANMPAGTTTTFDEDQTLATALQTAVPRYHFVSNPSVSVFWERAPYRSDETSNRVTRFISLGKFAGPTRWFYAFNLVIPFSESSATLPSNLTSNPFTAEKKLSIASTNTEIEEGSGSRQRTYGQDGRRDNKRRRQAGGPPVRPDTCFLCLSNPNLAKHLIASIGTKSYLALAKGPLPTPVDWTDKNIPGHVMIVPIDHVATLDTTTGAITPEDRDQIEIERWKYAIALSHLFSESASPPAVTVLFDISRKRGIHLHTQVFAVPHDRATKYDIESEFITQAEQAGLSMVERQLDQDETDYFRVQIIRPYNSEKEKTTTTLVIELPDDGTYFDLQFGRKVMARILELQHRVDWRACSQTEEEEKADCKNFKDSFKKYDFTL